MTRQILNRGTIANDGTGDTLRTASLKIEQNFQELYNKLGDGSGLMPLIDFDSDSIVFEGSTIDSFKTRLRVDDPTSNRNVRIPNYGGSLVMDSATQTLANKTLLSPVISTPQINDTSSDHQYVFAVSELAADRTVTLPPLNWKRYIRI
jgi:Bacteriophage T4 gp9/10-like protein.